MTGEIRFVFCQPLASFTEHTQLILADVGQIMKIMMLILKIFHFIGIRSAIPVVVYAIPLLSDPLLYLLALSLTDEIIRDKRAISAWT